jgi:hypothetical protein
MLRFQFLGPSDILLIPVPPRWRGGRLSRPPVALRPLVTTNEEESVENNVRHPRLIIVGFLLALLIPGCGDGNSDGQGGAPGSTALKVGFAGVDITPAVPVKLAGYGAAFLSDQFCRWSTGVHDSLYAQALAVEDRQGAAVILIVLDDIGTITNEIVKIQAGVSGELGIPEASVVVSSTHTHHGPDTIGLWGVIVPPQTGRQEDVIDGMVQGAIRAGVAAWQARVPARLAYGVGEETRVHFNKVFLDPNRKLDSTLTVLAAYDDQDRILGSLMNWAAHPTLMPEGNTLISCDYPGAYYRLMREGLGGGNHLFVNGAIGASVQALAPNDGWLKWLLQSATWEDVDDMGRLLAEDAMGLLASGTAISDPVIRRFETRTVEVTVENVFFKLCADAGLIPREVPPIGEQAATLLTTFAIGPVTFGSVPGEVVPDYSFALRDLMGGEAQVIIGLGMDWIGYAITPEQYDNPAYLYENSLCPSREAGEELMAVYHEVWDPVPAQ